MVIKDGQWMQKIYNLTSGVSHDPEFALVVVPTFNFFQWAKTKFLIRHCNTGNPRKQEWEIDERLAEICDLWMSNPRYAGMDFEEFIAKLGYDGKPTLTWKDQE
jgi:hypothetical protein